MCSHFFFLTIWFGILNISEGRVNFTSYQTIDSMKYTSLPANPFGVKSEIECALHCDQSQCCAASYHQTLQQCYLHQTCFGNSENANGWKVLQKDIPVNMIYINETKSWDGSQAHCASLGGRLTVVNTKEKHDLIISWKNAMNFTWVGASDRDEEGTWVWHNPTQQVLLDFWATGRPNNNRGREHCMLYSGRVGFLWDDYNCFELYGFICDIPVGYSHS